VNELCWNWVVMGKMYAETARDGCKISYPCKTILRIKYAGMCGVGEHYVNPAQAVTGYGSISHTEQ